MFDAGQKSYNIEIDNQKCRKCFYCIQICPTKAIKFDKDKVTIMTERCVTCGSCITECPHQAFRYEGGLAGVRELLAGPSRTIACLDPAFPATFDDGTAKQLVSALKRAGFTEVWEGAFGAELVRRAYEKLLDESAGKPLISTFCPVIVFYVQKYLPRLIPNLAPCVSPMIAVGRAVKKVKGPDWKTVYVTPCLAHMREMVAPEVSGAIDQVITFRDMKELLAGLGIRQGDMEETEFDGPKPNLGRVVSVVGGFNKSIGINFDVLMDDVTVTYGQKRAIGALNQLAAGVMDARFLDFVYCFGCVDGPFAEDKLSVLSRRQIVARYVKAGMTDQDREERAGEADRYGETMLFRDFMNMEQKLPVPTEEQIAATLRRIGKMSPNQNLDCRACGYPTCRDKAVAVAQGVAEAKYCLPYLLERSTKTYQQLEKSHRELQMAHQELEQAQAQLIRTEKLAALGQLAAGVAHEINNPLGTITIYAHLLLKSIEADDPRREDVALIVSEANRAKEIVQGLLSFARETKLRPGLTNVNELLDDVFGLVENQSLFHNIKIKKVFAPDLSDIIADSTQLKQVFLNIILNAAQAMEGKGSLTVTTTQEKKRIKVKIQDTGPGIPPEIINNIFSPFFTTKEKGTGLGLAISYGIIERHAGKITLETKLGKGTSFTVSLPVSADEDEQKDETRTDRLTVHTTNAGRGSYEQKTKNLTC